MNLKNDLLKELEINHEVYDFDLVLIDAMANLCEMYRCSVSSDVSFPFSKNKIRPESSMEIPS